jgi:uncharacterized membrane protein
VKTRTEAQARVDQIQAFRRELDLLRTAGHLRLSAEQQGALDEHHAALTRELAEHFDVDSDVRARQLSLGMRIASFLGAISLAASVFFLFYKFWGQMTTGAQVTILLAAPLLSFGFAAWLRTRDVTGYFTKLAALVSFCCFVLNISILGQIFNITPSSNALLVWAAFGAILAYGMDMRLLLVAAILCFVSFIAARFGTWAGSYWIDFGERPENFFPAALALLVVPRFFDHRRFDGFPATYRICGLLTLFLPILVLSVWGESSYLPFRTSLIEGTYQVVGFVLAGLAAWFGIRRGYPDVVNTSVTFFVVLLYTKFYDWWWEIMPKYLFFLVVGLTAVLFLFVMRRLRIAPGIAVEAAP